MASFFIIMEINLKNPLVFFDLETTGINVSTDRIVEISYLKLFPNGNKTSKTIRVNPGIPIPDKAIAIHGITYEMVKDCPCFKEIAGSLANDFEGCDFAGYNLTKFDIPLLAEEFIRADIDFDFKKHRLIDVQIIFQKFEQRTLSAAYKFYCNKELINAHNAEADTFASYEILKAQLDKYPDLSNNVDDLAKFSSHNNNVDYAGRIIYDENGTEIFNFGKYKGQAVEEVFKKDPSYYSWMMNGDFPLYTKKIITQIKLKKFSKNNKI